jgi:hypothetical protein
LALQLTYAITQKSYLILIALRIEELTLMLCQQQALTSGVVAWLSPTLGSRASTAQANKPAAHTAQTKKLQKKTTSKNPTLLLPNSGTNRKIKT